MKATNPGLDFVIHHGGLTLQCFQGNICTECLGFHCSFAFFIIVF